eukprot:TRINITY_DN13551_c0_g1_i1.p2 TRINITY_DN13551_c0_g1~~TRINITY_DN13551_c0_g1_i1.p2  ORF type:complete len:328 (-),score=12.28 TRINITY_DN13551_c0_g1_i1:724-1707(-)
MAWIHAARYGIPVRTKCRDWRLYQDAEWSSPVGRVLPLPAAVVRHARGLGIQNILRGSDFGFADARALLWDVTRIDWSQTPGFFWYDYESNTYHDIPRHPGGRDDGNAYTNMPPYGPNEEVEPDCEANEFAAYWPQELGFVPACPEDPYAPLPGPSVPAKWGPVPAMAVGPDAFGDEGDEVPGTSFDTIEVAPDVSAPPAGPAATPVEVPGGSANAPSAPVPPPPSGTFAQASVPEVPNQVATVAGIPAGVDFPPVTVPNAGAPPPAPPAPSASWSIVPNLASAGTLVAPGGLHSPEVAAWLQALSQEGQDVGVAVPDTLTRILTAA